MTHPGVRARLLFGVAALAFVPVAALTIAAVLTAHRTDLKCFWAGAHMLGRGLDPYDTAVWSSLVAGSFENVLGRIGPSPCPFFYRYPLTTALVTLPIGSLPLELAAVVWAGLGLAGLLTGIALLARAAQMGRSGAFALAFAVLVSQPAWWNAIFLQYGGLLVAGIGALALPSTVHMPARTSAAVLLLALKPHVAALAIVERFTAAAPRVRAVIVCVLGAGMAVSIVARPLWPFEWLAAIFAYRHELAAVNGSTWALVATVTGRQEAGLFVCAGALALFALAMRGAELRDVVDRLAVAVTAWLLVLPFMTGTDLLVLAVAWCAVLRRGGLALTVFVSGIVPWVAFRLSTDVGVGIVAPVTAVALAVALRGGSPRGPEKVADS